MQEKLQEKYDKLCVIEVIRRYKRIVEERSGQKLPDGNTVAVRLDPANPRSPSHYADAVPHAHIETVPTSSVSNGNYRPRDVTGRHTATGGVSDRGTNPNHNADVYIPMSPGRFPYD